MGMQIKEPLLLRSAMGKTHILRSRLVMDYTTSYFPLIMLGYPLESLVVRLYSEIDHLHLSSEAQCVSHLLPLGDCHTYLLPRHHSVTLRDLANDGNSIGHPGAVV